MYDAESMKKMAIKTAIEDLIEQMDSIEGKIGDDEESMEEPKMSEPKTPEMVEAVESLAEGEGMDEDMLKEKMDFMKGVKKPLGKKSMTVMMSIGKPSPMKSSKKKLAYG